MQTRTPRVVQLVAGLALLGAVIVTSFAQKYYSTPNAPKKLEGFEQLAHMQGWESRKLTLGDTELLDKKAEQMLNLSDYIHYSYERGGTVVDVYLAYWAPGNASYRSVMRHTPDRCWPNSGWLVQDAAQGQHFESASMGLMPCQYRTFRAEGGFRWVAYWYLLGDQLVEIRPDDPRPLWETRLPLKLEWLAQRRSQYFVRISANRPLDEIFAQPIGKELLKILSPLIATSAGK